VVFRTGANAGRAMEIKVWTAEADSVELYLSMPYPVASGDIITIYPGCDKFRECCTLVFENIDNFFGTPDIPGEDTLMLTPSAS
jgi:uncharacterized phage protein (TIGR02218 family)